MDKAINDLKNHVSGMTYEGLVELAVCKGKQMAQLNPSPLTMTPAWHVNPQTKLIVVEHSDLGRRSIEEQLYDDACDVGVALYNPTTTRNTRWYWAKEKKDADGDLQVTILRPCSESIYKYPTLEGWELHVLND